MPAPARRAGAAPRAAAAANGARAPAAAGGYKRPPPEILQIVDAPPQPSLSFSPDRKLILQLQRPPSLPPITEISRPELKLAGGCLSSSHSSCSGARAAAPRAR